MKSLTKSGQTITFAYDHVGRRTRKTVTGTGAYDLKFLWAGWKLAAELGADGTTVNKTFVWGRDFSDAQGSAGGAGALLAQISGTTVSYAIPDALGNIVAYANASGTIVASVEYSPYGKGVNASGSWQSYPIGYAGQYMDWEPGLVYYGYRSYAPKHGRFINRDPIEEQGGNNLYGFVNNAPTRGWDVLGLYWWCHPTAWQGVGYDDKGTYRVYPTDEPVGVSCEWIPEGSYSNNSGGSGGPSPDRGRGTSGGGPNGTGTASSSTAPNNEHPDCAGLRTRLAQASEIEQRHQGYLSAGGRYASTAAATTLSGVDNISLTGSITGTATSFWAYYAGTRPTQATVDLGRGMTGARNVVGAARTVGGVSFGFGIAGTAFSAVQFVDAVENRDYANASLAFENVGTGVAAMALGGPPGLALGLLQTGINVGIYAYQNRVDSREAASVEAAGERSAELVGQARAQQSRIAQEMAAKGCRQ